jgi:hypothetical protein
VSARECYQATVRYITNHVHRMDYPTYRAKGWQRLCPRIPVNGGE